jgi:transposase
MQTVKQDTFVGWDWAKHSHRVVILDATGQQLEALSVEHTAQGLAQIIDKLKALQQRGTVRVAIETPHGLAVEALLAAGIQVYALQPLMAKRLREALLGQSKNDSRDAWAMAEGLRLQYAQWHPLRPEDELTRSLQLLTRDEQDFIAQRTCLVNSLQHCLGGYYPQALELFDDWLSPSAWAFVLKWPTPQELIKTPWRDLQKFLHTHRLAKPERETAWKRIHAQAATWPHVNALSTAGRLQAELTCHQLQTIQEGLDEYRRQIEALWKQHPDQPIFRSFTGMGNKIGPRLMCEMGTDRSAFEDANDLQCYGGVAPREEQSGNRKIARCRHNANHVLQTNLFLWAKVTVIWCPWAKAFYEHYQKRGMWSTDIYRRLAAKWTRILWKCWQTGQPYDEAKWMENLKKRGSWLYEATLKVKQTNPKFMKVTCE